MALNRCFVIGIGETKLTINCVKILQEYGYEILGLISESYYIQEFSRNNKVPCLISLEKAYEVLKISKFDYLFSIDCPYILPNWLIKKPYEIAINYHDAPLPKYAGLHATSWAILNQETSHGITWHVMDKKVDCGDILKQRIFPVYLDDTALTLNLRCYEHAIEGFKELISDIEKTKLNKQPQDLSGRSYFSAHKKPIGDGIIDWNDSLDRISRLARALDFGKYSNNLSRLKIVLPNNQVLYPGKLEYIKKSHSSLPGTILYIGETTIEIANKDGVVRVADLYYSLNEKVMLKQFSELYPVLHGERLPVFSKEELQNITNIVQKSSPNNKLWQSHLKNIRQTFWRVGVGKFFREKIILQNKHSLEEIIALISVFLSKNLDQTSISLNYFNHQDRITEQSVYFDLGSSIPLTIQILPNQNIKSLIQSIKQLLSTVKDFQS